MSKNAKEAILAAARQSAQAHGYGGLNFRDLAAEVGIKAASIYHHFPSKAELGAAVARRYWEDTAADLEAMRADAPDALSSLRRYPGIFRRSLAHGNRLCMGSFMSAEYDDLPDAVKTEVQAFADINIAWLAATLADAGLVPPEESEGRARAIFAAVSGAQLLARSRSDITLFDDLIAGYQSAGLLPA
ncbi:TetR family transcriptional regulator [Chimaeribacter coloradensis]|uniref:TetR family transcriptional regulator n=1 Tax=Chimaeribacter coloradensis TaxID=2060068 RepID=A0A2N5E1B1_9GAMM|nr:TetR/AcrR family transcriptional regulator [Chimaeribacter coloradensis]PLR34122.1 TetR family transcriptional regulator [Chimaeribacter coloradensis]